MWCGDRDGQNAGGRGSRPALEGLLGTQQAQEISTGGKEKAQAGVTVQGPQRANNSAPGPVKCPAERKTNKQKRTLLSRH
jgi:hypothetical protein